MLLRNLRQWERNLMNRGSQGFGFGQIARRAHERKKDAEAECVDLSTSQPFLGSGCVQAGRFPAQLASFPSQSG